MENVIHADIFFFITSIAVIILTLLLVVAGVFIVKILRNIQVFSETLRREGNLLAEDLSDLRERVKKDGVRAFTLARFFSGLFKRHRNYKKDK